MDRLFQFLLCGIFISPQQIFSDRTRKQHRFLQYNADLAAQLLQIIVPHIGTVHLHAAFAHIVEPRNQRNEEDLPEPVPPMIPIVCPFSTRKLMSVRESAPAFL